MITPYKQIFPHQCTTIAEMGYRTLINLRQDGECEKQPCNEEIASSAKKSGLTYHHLPINGECVLDRKTIETFVELFNDSPKPALVFCGTGSRAKRLYQCAKISGLIE